MAEEKKLDVMKNEDKSQVLDVLNEDLKSKIGNSFALLKNENTNPSIGMGITFLGESQMILFVSSYVNYINERKQKNDAVAYGYSMLESLVKRLKERVKEDHKVSLTAKMLSENFDTETLSLNGRSKITVRRLFKINK
jgi:hypothetical protein